MNKLIIRGLAIAGIAAAMGTTVVVAQDKKSAGASSAQNLEQLLQQTRNARAAEAKANAERERRFQQDRNQQAALLAQAKQELAAAEARSRELSARFDENEKKLTELQAQLDAKGGNLGELFGTVRVVAGDVSSVLYNSMITTRFPDRGQLIDKLAHVKALPSIDELEQLWFEMQREATETGRVVNFTAKVIEPDGTPVDQQVTMIGGFTAIADGKYLSYLPTQKALTVLARQPHDFAGFEDIADATEGYEAAVVDPSRGPLMSLYLLRPTFIERVQRGHMVGYLIITMGLFAALVSIYQFFFLLKEDRAVKKQLANVDRPTTDNPLGRVLASFKGDKKQLDEDPEVVELRISEAVLREIPPLERFQSFLRLVVAAGPLFGLVGTVIGMIITFQAITESGSGDPRLMANGIGTAMMAAVLGLGVAIPFLFVNAYFSSVSKRIIQIMDEQSTGLLAERLEQKRGA